MSKNPHAVALGRLGGKAGKGISTPAKRRAAKQNGKKGGRPRLGARCSRCGQIEPHDTAHLCPKRGWKARD